MKKAKIRIRQNDRIRERKNLKQRRALKTNKHIYNFQQFQARSFAENIFIGKITLSNANENQSNLLIN